ncbi:BTAD domain-containing putative transcriptional regulator [Actinosynnema sp. NPDC020468]|uniref:AfsR/SARP family transcriptional regulator n=1 Tax=Actinosynnema sp. NPDC020468 TaxID=3154488 RepID=UPI0033C33A54
MEFRLLGDISAWHDGDQVELGHARQRGVLAALLVDVEPVPLDRLVARVWGDDAPLGVRTTLYGYVHQLRRALAPTTATIVRRSGGYAVTVDPSDVDLHRFTDLLARARDLRGDERSLALVDEALGLWRGEPCAGVESAWFSGVRAGLERQHLAAVLDRNDIALRRGEHHELLTDLAALVHRYPLDERVAAQFMLAAYRGGRQADALTCYDRLLKRLADELGADPGPEARLLHERILRADPVLTPTDRAPRQLPAPPTAFLGRERELARLDEALTRRGTVVISAIDGTGGIGKTWLALRWAHDHAEEFTDGHLYADLRGFDPTDEPTPPSVVLKGFLDTLGVPAASVPAGLDAQSGLFRTLLAERRMLVLLDNAADSAQVVPLLPAGESVVLVTSRRRLSGLVTGHGATALELDVLDEDTARALLARHLGAERLAAEPEAADRVLRHCAGLPLAIGIAAARAGAEPTHPLAALADELDDDASRLDAFDAGELTTNLRAVLSLSLRALSPRAVTLLGLLGIAPGPDIGLAAATALAGRGARATLTELENARLVRQHTPGRYRMHDLVRLYAAELGALDPGRSVAGRRLVDHHLRTAFDADRLVHPHRPPIVLWPEVEGSRPASIADEEAAWEWFTVEHQNNLGVVQRLAAGTDAAWQLAWCLDNFHTLRGHANDAIRVWEVGLAAALLRDDVEVRLLAHRGLGRAQAVAGPLDDALRNLEEALALARRSGDDVAVGRVHLIFAVAWELRQDAARALPHAVRALEVYRGVGEPPWVVEALTAVAMHETSLGEHERARAHAAEALALAREHRIRRGEAGAVRALARVAHRTGEHAEALGHYEEAIALHRVEGNAFAVVDLLEGVGDLHVDGGRPELARQAWQQALDLCHDQCRATDVDRIQARLADPRSTQETPPADPAQ